MLLQMEGNASVVHSVPVDNVEHTVVLLGDVIERLSSRRDIVKQVFHLGGVKCVFKYTFFETDRVAPR